jgi:hypothetical protein
VAQDLFGFVQFEFGFRLGPSDGRYVVRERADDDPHAILVLSTLGAPERRRLRGRRRETVAAADPEPVPTTRATVVAATPLAGAEQGANWLAELRRDAAQRDGELERALRTLNRALHVHRVASADPYARDADPGHALVTRIGYGAGDAVVDGRYAQAWELPRPGARRTRRSMEAPEERFAAVLGARERVLACEEIVLRARADVDAGRRRESALQARIALEAVLAELDADHAGRRAALEDDREKIADAANAALAGELPRELADAVAASVARMEAALRARRLDSAR